MLFATAGSFVTKPELRVHVYVQAFELYAICLVREMWLQDAAQSVAALLRDAGSCSGGCGSGADGLTIRRGSSDPGGGPYAGPGSISGNLSSFNVLRSLLQVRVSEHASIARLVGVRRVAKGRRNPSCSALSAYNVWFRGRLPPAGVRLADRISSFMSMFDMVKLRG